MQCVAHPAHCGFPGSRPSRPISLLRAGCAAGAERDTTTSPVRQTHVTEPIARRAYIHPLSDSERISLRQPMGANTVV